ncbi:MAG: hypothetical protein KDC31_06790 [Saprospiraceae bacterium]|jgi:photosystem II stability/assembly factor-like uncharacterized protein|nr:hypothetical protein [Candidatus Parvibacillus calidus]MBX2937067.1 hypothetical protein [Saprospiraceae bacterium]MBX7179189.1 hypothetical protein [Saprospiraceae bacterium]MCB0590981.1 hypothetical protein [Saprospiraceae bacterium]MCO5282449.1 YCF48-related protein [Saprospiraceae bacterium]
MKRIIFLGYSLLMVQLTIFGQGSWRKANDAPVFNRIDDIAFINDSVALMGQDGKIYRSDDGGDNWILIGNLPHKAYVRSIEFLNDSTGFIGTIFDTKNGVALYRTDDGGKNWHSVSDRVQGGMYGICGLDHIGSTIIGVGIYSEPGRFYISRDGGDTWKSYLIPESAALVDCVMLDENTFLVAGNSPDGRKGLILKSKDGGETWAEVAKSQYAMSFCWKLSLRDDGLGLGSIEEAPTAFITHDHGDTWEEVLVDAQNKDTLRFGGAYFINEKLGWLGIQWGMGTWETRDGGKNWKPIPFGGAINKIRGTNKGRALATGNTIYIYDGLSITKDQPTDRPVRHSLKVSPNPAKDRIRLDIFLPNPTSLRLDLLDEQGYLIRQLFRGGVPAGNISKEYSIGNLSPGTYVIWMRTNEGHLSGKLIVY